MSTQPFKTALRHKTHSVPYKTLLSKNLIQPITQYQAILDYGCGHGYDFQTLSQQNYNIVGYDKFNPLFADSSLLSKHYDVIICNYVFNVIESIQQRLYSRQKRL